ncbi:MAG: arylsulfatase [Azospirillum sp.]|nr:arylsulfatase [Azospirillum sp.]MCA3267442.1 arylsulfatase [Azospirillum sp.]MCZ8124543.1 aspartate/glutamate racemase family protein [Magnetospirillum sp.]
MTRIFLIHALRDSVEPARGAMARGWPEADVANLLDDSLSADLAKAGALEPAMIARFVHLGRYARDQGADGILFTCSAFGPAIEAVAAELPIPVLKPNESAFRAALAHGKRIGLLVTFAGSLAPLTEELQTMAGPGLELHARIVPAALGALQAGDGAAHDAKIAEAAAHLPPVDALVLGQFSMARAARALADRVVYTTPDAAVADLKRRITSLRAR